MPVHVLGLSLAAPARQVDAFVPAWLVLVLLGVGAVVLVTALAEVLVALARRGGAGHRPDRAR